MTTRFPSISLDCIPSMAAYRQRVLVRGRHVGIILHPILIITQAWEKSTCFDRCISNQFLMNAMYSRGVAAEVTPERGPSRPSAPMSKAQVSWISTILSASASPAGPERTRRSSGRDSLRVKKTSIRGLHPQPNSKCFIYHPWHLRWSTPPHFG